MMILYLDTSDNQKTIVALDEFQLVKPTSRDKSQQVLGLIEEILTGQNQELKDISEIKVETGPGSFTGLRVGVAVGNALAWALNIPVNGEKRVEPEYN